MPQPTKLDKPITFTFETAEEALVALAQFYTSFTYAEKEWDGKFNLRGLNHISSSNFNRLTSTLKSAGIDWRTWEPPQPFKIAGYDAKFNSDGSTEFGRAHDTIIYNVVIDRATLLEVLKRSDQAMRKHSEGVWPKYFERREGRAFRVNNPAHLGTFLNPAGEEESTCKPSGVDWAHMNRYKQITRAEAAAILGRDV